MLRIKQQIFFCFLVLFASTLLAADRPPNVLLIVSDDHAWSDYSFMQHPVIRTPRLDQLAKESLLYTRGYVPMSLCRPSLMTIMTGRYPHEHCVVGNDPPPGTDRKLMLKHVHRLPTIAKLLSERGYLCLQTGKWWEGNFKEGGFTHGMSHGDPNRRGRHGDVGLTIGRQGLQPIYDFIDQRGEKPFFIWYAPMMPHAPHAPPEALLEKYKSQTPSLHVAKYYAMCEWFDQTCGELLDYLKMKQLDQDTMVVYLADNGWIQSPDRPQFAPRSKRSPYDGGIRTPIMIRWPGRVAATRDDVSLVSSIDIAPTILAACGVQPPADFPGRNLLDAKHTQSPRDALFGDIYEHDVADIDRPRASLLFRWCVTKDWKLILPVDGGQSELYRIRTDPWEKENVAENNPDKVADLTKRINGWWNPE